MTATGRMLLGWALLAALCVFVALRGWRVK